MTEQKHSPFANKLLQTTPTQSDQQAHIQPLHKIQTEQQKTAKKQVEQQQKQQHKCDKQARDAAQIQSGGKPLWWLTLMFICAIVYLFPEAVFNAALTDVAGDHYATEADLRTVELFGRSISGIGVTLLLADLLLKGKWLTSVARGLSGLVLIAVISWPTVFFGQKWLVDHFIIDASSAQDRQQAYLTQLLRNAMIEKSVTFTGIDYDPDAEHTATEKAFLSVFGGLVYADNQLLDTLAARKQEIMTKFVYDHAMARFSEHYGQYDDLRQQLRQQYVIYANNSEQYNSAINKAPQQARQSWSEMQAQVSSGWQQYQQSSQAFDNKIARMATQIAPKMYDYFERRQGCAEFSSQSSQKRCYQRLQQGYDQEIQRYAIPYIPADEWLKREPISTAENIGTSLVAGVMTFGLYTAAQAVDALTGGDANFKDYRTVYTNDSQHYQAILRTKLGPDFVNKSGGYPLDIRSLQQFSAHKATASQVRARLRKQGVVLATGWRLDQRRAFDVAVQQQVRQQANKSWQTAIAAKGTSMPPNLSWQAFQRHPDTQDKLRGKAAEFYVKPLLADWNNRQFKHYVIDVNVKRKTQEYLAVLNAQRAEFADGGSLATTGKSALRATLIPPISMLISLVLVLLTLLKLPLKARELIRLKRNGLASEAAKQQQYPAGLSTVILAVAIFVLPMIFTGNQYTQSRSAVNYFFDAMEDNDAKVVAFAMKWLLVTQPLAQPIGATIDNHLGISQGFNAISAPISALDEWLWGSDNHSLAQRSEALTQQSASQSLLPLTIINNVPGAQIAIMNIKPKYHTGMRLPAGRYDVKISAPGYAPLRKWLHLQDHKRVFVMNF